MTNNQSFFESIDKSEKIFTNDYTVSRIRKKSSLLTVESAVFALPKKKRRETWPAAPARRVFLRKKCGQIASVHSFIFERAFFIGKNEVEKSGRKAWFFADSAAFPNGFSPIFLRVGKQEKMVHKINNYTRKICAAKMASGAISKIEARWMAVELRNGQVEEINAVVGWNFSQKRIK